MGVVFFVDGALVVYEAVGLVKTTSLREWIERGSDMKTETVTG
jgi:hypothetical protein